MGRVQLSPNRYVNLLYRFRADAADLEFERNEVGFSLGNDALRLSGDYIYIDNDASNVGLEEREEIRWSLFSKFHEDWSVSLSTQRDLTEGGGTLFTTASLIYEDECFIFSTNAERRFTEDAEFEPSDSVVFRVTFKHLGEIESAVK